MSMRPVQRCVRYLLVAMLGTAVVLLATEAVRVIRVRTAIDEATLRMGDGRPTAALALLERCGGWARLHPPLERRRLAAMIRCQMQRGHVAFARRLAEEFEATFEKRPYPGGIAGVESMVAHLAGVVLLHDDRGREMTKRDGFAIMEETAAHVPPAASSGAPTMARTSTAAAAQPSETVRTEQQPAYPPPSPEQPETPRTTTPSSDAEATAVPSGTATTETQKPLPIRGPHWAIVQAPDTRSLDLSGKPYRVLDMGTILSVTETRETSHGFMAVCRDGSGMGASMLVPVDRLEIYPGALTAVSRAERDLRVRRISLLRRIDALTQKPADNRHGDTLSGNPHAAEYRAAIDAYRAIVAKARALQSQWESSSGAPRMEAADELRRIKNDVVPIKQAYDTAKEKAEAWAAANQPRAADAGAGDAPPPPPPELEPLRAQLQGIEEALQALQD